MNNDLILLKKNVNNLSFIYRGIIFLEPGTANGIANVLNNRKNKILK